MIPWGWENGWIGFAGRETGSGQEGWRGGRGKGGVEEVRKRIWLGRTSGSATTLECWDDFRHRRV